MLSVSNQWLFICFEVVGIVNSVDTEEIKYQVTRTHVTVRTATVILHSSFLFILFL